MVDRHGLHVSANFENASRVLTRDIYAQSVRLLDRVATLPKGRQEREKKKKIFSLATN